MSADLAEDVRGALALPLQRDLPIIHDCFLAARTVQHRLCDVGVLTRGKAVELGVVGMVARASRLGVPLDARQAMSHGASAPSLSRRRCSTEETAGRERASASPREIDASLGWLAAVLASQPSWGRPRLPVGDLRPNHLALAIVEGWRGEVVHCIETGPASELFRYKVRDPSLGTGWASPRRCARQSNLGLSHLQQEL